MKYLSNEHAGRIIEGAGQILLRTGMKVVDEDILQKLNTYEGIAIKDDRAYISETRYENFLKYLKQLPQVFQKHGKRLHGEASLYTYQYRETQSGTIKKFTMESLAQQARFVEKAKALYPMNPVIPGYPTDVPAEISSLARYKIAVENCSSHWPLAPDSVTASDYLFEMAQVMNEKIICLPVYMISPLTLGGDSFDIVIKNSHRLESFYTFSMPNMGVTTPMNLSMGLSMVLAEVAGGAILIQLLTGLKADIKPNLFPFDFKSFNIAFGTPEKFLYEQLSAEVVAYLKNGEPDYSSTNIHTWAKAPDGRSAMEKGMMIMAGALFGAKRFYCIGTLSLDELFDPLQMIQDLEAIVFAQKILDGVPKDEIEDTMQEEIREGLETGFIFSDRSLDEHGRYMKFSGFSPKDSLQKWVSEGRISSTDILKNIYEKINQNPVTYTLETDRQRELDRIFCHALDHC